MIVNIAIWIVNAISTILFIYCILSWFPQNGVIGSIRKTLGMVFEPILKPIQKIIPPVGGVDFSPLVLMLLLQLIMRLIIGML